jgi:glycine C-acetyltransferase
VYGTVKDELAATLKEIEDAGLYKRERELTTPQAAHVATAGGSSLNFCANNYLGFADHPDVVAASRNALDEWGFGMASVRFICGTQTQHTLLEQRLSQFLGMEATILFGSCFDANGGVFEVLFGAEDAIVSDELNHASIIDGIRLSKAARFRYKNADMGDLRAQLEAARAGGARRVCVVTDGVFSMDGSYAPLDQICDLADEFQAMVLVDDSHAVGFVGEGGRGTPELFGVMDRVDIITGTLGKALGGASGGYVTSHQEVAGSLAALDLVSGSSEARETLRANSALFRELMTDAGFELLPGSHPITPVMFPGEDGARQAAEVADHMLAAGVYVVAFSFPVVPRGRARIRVQLSAAHSEADVRECVDAFVAARAAVG